MEHREKQDKNRDAGKRDENRDGKKQDADREGKKRDADRKRGRLWLYALLHLLLLFYALSSIFSKNAAKAEFLSVEYVVSYAAVFAILAVYAVFWQMILKKLSLTAAMANKSVTVIWGLVYGALIFGEQITIWNLLGALVIIVGIAIVAKEEKEQESCM